MLIRNRPLAAVAFTQRSCGAAHTVNFNATVLGEVILPSYTRKIIIFLFHANAGKLAAVGPTGSTQKFAKGGYSARIPRPVTAVIIDVATALLHR